MSSVTSPHVPTEETLAQVRAGAAFGTPYVDIARLLGITEGQLLKHYRKELETGAMRADQAVHLNLYNQAAKGKGRDSIKAAQAWLNRPRSAVNATLSYAEFGKLHGLGKSRVGQYVAKGMPLAPDGRIDPSTASRWIEENIDPIRSAAKRDAAEKTKSGEDSRRQKLQIDVERARFEFAKDKGQFIERAVVEKFIFEWTRAQRDTWIGWIPRIASRIAHDFDIAPQAAFAFMNEMVREQLLEIAEGPRELAEAAE